MEAPYQVTLRDTLVWTFRTTARPMLLLLAIVTLGNFAFDVATGRIPIASLAEPAYWARQWPRVFLGLIVPFATGALMALPVCMVFVVWRYMKLLPGQRQGVFSANQNEIALRDTDGNRTVLKWSTVKSLRERRSDIAIRLRTGPLLHVSKKLFSPADVAVFRSIALDSGVPAKLLAS